MEKTKGPAANLGIRPIAPSDAQDLQRNCFPKESPEYVIDYIKRALRFVDRGQSVHLVAESSGHAVANAQLICWSKRAEIGSLVVAEPFRGRGIGTALIEALTNAASKLGAEQVEIGVDKGNEQVLELYRRLGFTPHKVIRVPGSSVDYDHVVYLVKPVPNHDLS